MKHLTSYFPFHNNLIQCVQYIDNMYHIIPMFQEKEESDQKCTVFWFESNKLGISTFDSCNDFKAFCQLK